MHPDWCFITNRLNAGPFRNIKKPIPNASNVWPGSDCRNVLYSAFFAGTRHDKARDR